jgi:hypothetical protein
MGVEKGFYGFGRGFQRAGGDFIRRETGEMAAGIVYRKFMEYRYTFNGFRDGCGVRSSMGEVVCFGGDWVEVGDG